MARLKNRGVLAWLYMMRVCEKMERLAGEHLQQYDLTGAQFDVLAQLILAEGISQQELSEKLLVTKGNVCGLINRMEARGLVKRNPDPQDRRAYLLCLSPKGRTLAERVIPEQEQFMGDQMASLSDEQQQTLRRLLRELEKALPD
jgi:MarR family transcriptional regulator, organic hydroperoxide resistance regulator